MPAAHRLARRALIRVGGPEARPFLHRLLTQEVETLGDGELRYGALLTPQGRVRCDLFLWGEADGVCVEVDARARDDLHARLKLFRLRAAVTLELDDTPVLAAPALAGAGGGAPPAGAAWRPDPRTPLAGWRALGAPASDAPEDGGGSAQVERLALGLPDVVDDGLADRAYATEALLDLLGGVDYRKGCFPGQETTSRMKRRGGVRSRVLPLRVEGAARGAEVLAGALRAGEVVASGDGRALALLRLDRLDGALTVDGVAARVERPPWWPGDEPPFTSAPSLVEADHA